MVYNKESLIKFFNDNNSNINSELLLIFLGESSNNFSLEEQDQIMPEILIEIDNERVKLAKEKLALECRTAIDKNFDFRLQYFKFKLGILSDMEEEQLRKMVMSALNFTNLLGQTDIDILYRLLFLSNKELPKYVEEMLADYIGGVSIYFARKYKVREFAISILIALNIRNQFERVFFENAIEFLEYIQTDFGYFGYDNPFNQSGNKVNPKILNSFYCILTLEYLYNAFDGERVAL